MRIAMIGFKGIPEHIFCFSFYPSKNLAAFGDGGMVVSNGNEITQKIKMLRDHGQTKKYEHLAEGHNSGLDEIQAAILRVKLKRLEEWNEYPGRSSLIG